jgi:hypothetical protein
MGFGLKTDYRTGRKLDLDKSYRLLIKPVVEERGVVCVRADEIRHSGAIDVPMFRELLTADVVVADLSTANCNALYELGIRHAFRPETTIVISENRLPYPFDLNHVQITPYTHLGDAIDYDEVMRFRKVMGETLDAVLRKPNVDSPVYTFLQQLQPPYLPVAAAGEATAGTIPTAGPGAQLAGGQTATLAALIEEGEAALRHARFCEAKDAFAAALKLYAGQNTTGRVTYDPYLVQRLVLATYKAKLPTELEALAEAKSTLDLLAPHESNDPETAGLAGDLEKGLFDNGQGDLHLDYAIAYYGRGFYLRSDVYNGIKLAHVLTVRADTSRDSAPQDTVADLVRANRIRKDILEIAEPELVALRERKARAQGRSDEVVTAQAAQDSEHEFWCLAAMAEAWFGLGDLEKYQGFRKDAETLGPPSWIMGAFEEQVAKLGKLLDRNGSLLTPPWPGASRAPV